MEHRRRPRGRIWRLVRQHVLIRDGHRCQMCGAVRDLEVHHIIPVSEGGASCPGNLVTLCRDCHCAVHHAYAPVKDAHVEGAITC